MQNAGLGGNLSVMCLRQSVEGASRSHCRPAPTARIDRDARRGSIERASTDPPQRSESGGFA